MYRYIVKLITVAADFLFFNLAFVFIFWLRFKSGYLPDSFSETKQISEYFEPMLLLSVYWFVLFLFSGLYRNWIKESRFDQVIVVLKTITFGVAAIFLFTGLGQFAEFFKTYNWHVIFTKTKTITLFQYWLSLCVMSISDRIIIDSIFKKMLRSGIGTNKVLIVGANNSGKELRERIQRYPALGQRVIGYIDDDGRKKGTSFDDLPIMGTYSELTNICTKNKIDSVIISNVSSSPNEILKIIRYCAPTKVTVHMEPDLMDVVKGHIKTHQLYGFPLLVLLPEHMPGWEASIKKFMDIVCSMAILISGLPIWLLIAFIIKIDSKGPVIFRQIRVGQNGKPFTLNKFRTMVNDAEKYSGPVWAGTDDKRITRFGRFMRKTRIDEIPQLINVLLGEMSLVGPRPERPFFVEKLIEEIPIYARRLKMKPGITGWAQVKHHYDITIDDVKQKVMYDLYYFENMSLSLDLKILLKSVLVVLTGKGAH